MAWLTTCFRWLVGGIFLSVGLLLLGLTSSSVISAEVINTAPAWESGATGVPYAGPGQGLGFNPKSGPPGSLVTISGKSFRPFSPVASIAIGGLEVLGGRTINTDASGDFTANGLLVPDLDPGIYNLVVKVGAGSRQVTSVSTFQVTAPGGSSQDSTPVASGLAPLLDANNLERLFHFDNTVKKWTFYDPRPEFGGANTITELFPGKVYWIKVKGDQVAVLNGRERNLTCVNKGAPNENCWNQVAW